MKERRNYFRYQFELPIQIELDEGNISINSVTKNISCNGVAVEMPVAPELLSSAILKIDLTRLGDRVRVIPAIVVRRVTKLSVRESVEEVGFVFDSLDERQKEELERLLRRKGWKQLLAYRITRWLGLVNHPR